MTFDPLPYGAVAGGCADCDSFVHISNDQYPFVEVNTYHSDGCPALTTKRSRMINRNEHFKGENQ